MSKGMVLVTGGAGFIGCHLAERLVAEGYSVRVFDNFSTGKPANLHSIASKVQVVEGCVTHPKEVRDAADGAIGIFHLAAVVSVQRSFEEPEYCHAVNSTGILNVMEAARHNGAKVIFSSSAAVYGDTVAPPISESAHLAPKSPYGAQKLYGEGLLRSYALACGVPSVALRYFNVYGPKQDPKSPYSGVISIFAEKIQASETITIHGDGKQTRDFIYVSDVVEANLKAFQSKYGAGEPLNIGTGRSITLLQLAKAMGRVFANMPTIEHAEPRVGDIRHSCSDPSAADRKIRFRAKVELADGLRALAEHVKRGS